MLDRTHDLCRTNGAYVRLAPWNHRARLGAEVSEDTAAEKMRIVRRQRLAQLPRLNWESLRILSAPKTGCTPWERQRGDRSHTNAHGAHLRDRKQAGRAPRDLARSDAEAARLPPGNEVMATGSVNPPERHLVIDLYRRS